MMHGQKNIKFNKIADGRLSVFEWIFSQGPYKKNL